MSFKQIDLNLFKVFESVMRRRSVSQAAKELGVSASAVSHALGRLREALGDELFVYTDTAMTPTPRALAISTAVLEGLSRIDEALAAEPFRPDHSVRTFRIAATEYSTIIILSGLIARLAVIAPQLELRVFPYSRTDVVSYLDKGLLDLVVGWFNDVPERIQRTSLLIEREALLVRRGHPLTEGVPSKSRLFAFPFAVVELVGAGDQGSDGFLNERGVWRRIWIDRLVMETGDDEGAVGHVAVSLPHYSAVPGVLSRTDMVATIPERLARQFADAGGHQLLKMPYAPLEVTMEAIWHERRKNDSGLQWLLGELADVTRDI